MTLNPAPGVPAQQLFSRQNPSNGMAAKSSSTLATEILARFAAGALVVASAGFGCLYAWRSNAAHGQELAALAVLFAGALELAKPLAVSGAFAALGRWRTVPRGAALAVLALAAVAYSLSAELTLWAGARGDTAASRAAQIERENGRRAGVEAARREMAGLPETRSAAELQPLIDAILADKRLDGCEGTWLETVRLREKCIEANALRSELGRAKRRAALQEVVTAPEGDAPAVKAADPAASALGTYLAALGVAVKPDAISEWLALIPVLALEIGSAFAGLLASGASAHATAIGCKCAPQGSARSGMFEPAPVASVTMAADRTAAETTATPLIAIDRPTDGVQRAILDRLKAAAPGGRITATQRGLARLIGVPQSTLNAQLHTLAAVGLIGLSASQSGTTVVLHA